MHEGLNDFIAKLEQSIPALPANQPTWHFVIDQQTVPDAQAKVFAVDEPTEQILLFQRTDFHHLADQGPLWFSAEAGSALQQLGESLCQQHSAGIALCAEDRDAAIAHACWLLTVNDGSGGQSLINYYRPDIWAAMALTSSEQLFAPWSAVYSPAPHALGARPQHWIGWHAPLDYSPNTVQKHYSLAASTQLTQRTLRWVYWIDRHYTKFNAPHGQQLPAIVDNLELLVDHGISEGRWLVRLADLVSRTRLEEQEPVMAILRGKADPFIKVDQILAQNL